MPLVSPPLQASSRGSLNGAAPAFQPFSYHSSHNNPDLGVEPGLQSVSLSSSAGSMGRRDLSILPPAPPNFFEEPESLMSPSTSRASSIAGLPTRGPASLVVYNLPSDITPREAHLLFTFAPDYLSCELSRVSIDEPHSNSGAHVLTAKFRTVSAASNAQGILEGRSDLFCKAEADGIMSPASHHALRCEVRGSSVGQKSRFLFSEDESCSITPPGSANTGASSVSAPMSASASNAFSLSSADRMFSSTSPRSMFPTRSLFADHLLARNGQERRPSTGSTTPTSSAPGTQPPRRASVPSRTYGPEDRTPSYPTAPAPKVSGRIMPPANPADQNPPCNTLYVGNLPPDTREEELKELFSSRPGYRRLCFRTKPNGPMCFVEFEDEDLAGHALEELYGFALSNSVKGGIRLSYSKNPLGVRSNRRGQE